MGVSGFNRKYMTGTVMAGFVIFSHAVAHAHALEGQIVRTCERPDTPAAHHKRLKGRTPTEFARRMFQPSQVASVDSGPTGAPLVSVKHWLLTAQPHQHFD